MSSTPPFIQIAAVSTARVFFERLAGEMSERMLLRVLYATHAFMRDAAAFAFAKSSVCAVAPKFSFTSATYSFRSTLPFDQSAVALTTPERSTSASSAVHAAPDRARDRSEWMTLRNSRDVSPLVPRSTIASASATLNGDTITFPFAPRSCA